MLEAHWIRWALALALARAGNSKAARIPMMAITTSNSISVKANARPVAHLPAICAVGTPARLLALGLSDRARAVSLRGLFGKVVLVRALVVFIRVQVI